MLFPEFDCLVLLSKPKLQQLSTSWYVLWVNNITICHKINLQHCISDCSTLLNCSVIHGRFCINFLSVAIEHMKQVLFAYWSLEITNQVDLFSLKLLWHVSYEKKKNAALEVQKRSVFGVCPSPFRNCWAHWWHVRKCVSCWCFNPHNRHNYYQLSSFAIHKILADW